MKLTFFLLTAAFLQVSAKGLGQQVTISLKDAPMEKVFQEIEKQTGFGFLYTKRMLQGLPKVSLEIKNATIEQVLNKCLEDKPLEYSIENKTIVIKRKEGISKIQLPPPIDVRGRVVNETGEPIAGASVMVKGTNQGTNTNGDGYFELRNVDENATLVISAVNIEPYEVRVNGRINLANIGVRMKVTAQEEVIINAGYYQVREKERTGNISRLTSGEIEKQPVANVLEAMQSRLPGVVVAPRSGVSGSFMAVQIRGQNSLRTEGNYPLYVIDGVPIDSRPISSQGNLFGNGMDPLSSINPTNIESIEVLKDADATSIYGSRGANGVILINTKSAMLGKTTAELNVYTGIGRVAQKMGLLNTAQFLQMRKEAFENDGPAALAELNNPAFAIYFPDLKIWDSTRYTDWQKILFGGTSRITDVNATISGGNENTSFRFGGGYRNESTVFAGDFGYRRGTGLLSVNHLSSDKKLSILLSLNYGIENNNQYNGTPVYDALTTPPNAPTYTSNGEISWEGYSSFTHPPLSRTKINHKATTNNYITNARLGYEIIKDLKLITSLGYSDTRNKEIISSPRTSMRPNSTDLTSSIFGNRGSNSWIAEPQLSYSKRIGAGQFDIITGSTWQSSHLDMQNLLGIDYLSDNLLGNINAAANVVKMSADEIKYRYTAVYGRVAYKLLNKYYLNITGRRDGSSRFGSDKRFANFGAVGAAWIFSNEKLFKETLPVISFGKIRSSYGSSGSDNISDYGYLSTYVTSFSNYQGNGVLVTNGLANKDYAWEVNKKFEATIDLGFLNDRILFSTSYYRNRSSNQLVGYPLPTITGFSLVQANLNATVQNTGWEFELKSINLHSKTIKWLTSVALTIPRNKLVSYPNLEGSSYANTYVVGEPITILKLYKNTGVDDQTGFYQFLDVDNNGFLNNADRQTIINIGRNFYGGINNNFSFSRFQISFFIEAVKQTVRGYMGTFLQGPGVGPNQPDFIINSVRWKNPGDRDIQIQRFTTNSTSYDNARNSNLIIEDGSFLRLKTVHLAYLLPAKLVTNLKLNEGSLYLQAQNILTLTSYKGFDPEIPGNSQIPQLRMVMAGLKLKF